MTKKGYSSAPLSINRKMVIASIAINKRSAINSLTEIDVTDARHLIRETHEKGGPKISFKAYLVSCLARTLKDHPELNSFIRRRKLILLDDVTISVLVERELGDLTGSAWIRLIPGFLLKTFVRIADRNITMAKRYGKVAVTAVGMFSKTATWFIPHGTATVLLTVGSIVKKPVWRNEQSEPREMLHITASFDHEIVDGAPAARFIKQFSEMVEGGSLLDAKEVNS